MSKKKKRKRKQKQKTGSIHTKGSAMPDVQTIKIAKAIQTGLQHHQAGQLQHAENIYRQVLAIDPDNADANHLLGAIAYQVGQNDMAIHLIHKAVQSKPDRSELHYDLGNVLKKQGYLKEAATSYQAALTIKPDYAEAHNNLGAVFTQQEKLEAAAESYRNAISIKPDYAEAHNNLGVVLKGLGHLAKAAESYQNAVSIKPDYIEALNNLGNAFKEQGRLEEAIASYRNALSIKPNCAEAYNNLGILHLEQENLEEAALNYRNALAIKPDYFEAHSDLGVVLIKQGRLEAAINSYRNALNIKPDQAATHSNLLLGLNYVSNISREDIYNESLQWDHQQTKKIPREVTVYANKKEKKRKLKVGYVSPDFRTHSVAFFFEPLLKAHNKENFEIFCYSNASTPDNVTKRLKANADHWLSIVGLSDEDVTKQIKRDNIDILVDLAGHTHNNRLLVFAYKPAPIQVTWLGYPNTTGMQAMDYRFTDEIADPIGESDNLHSEELIRLDSGFLCYQGNESASEKAALPCLERGYITFGSFNNLTKTTPEVVNLWSNILRAVPNSHILLKSKQLVDEEVRNRCRAMFDKEGIQGERVELYGWLSETDHLDLYNNIDIGLDPFPYNGTTTSCEALWMGVPVVTLLGDRHAGRVGASILSHIGLEEFIAENPSSYVDIALDLSKDVNKLAILRNGLRHQMMNSPICDESIFAQNVESAYHRMWEKYINTEKDSRIQGSKDSRI